MSKTSLVSDAEPFMFSYTDDMAVDRAVKRRLPGAPYYERSRFGVVVSF